MAWVGFVDSKTRNVVPAAWFGKEEGYLSEAVISAEDVPLGRGPTGVAIRENSARLFHRHRVRAHHGALERTGASARVPFVRRVSTH